MAKENLHSKIDLLVAPFEKERLEDQQVELKELKRKAEFKVKFYKEITEQIEDTYSDNEAKIKRLKDLIEEEELRERLILLNNPQ